MIFTLLLASFLNNSFNIEESLDINLGFDSNVFYQDTNIKHGYYFEAKPELSFYYKNNIVKTGLNGALEYKRYFAYTEQSNLFVSLEPFLLITPFNGFEFLLKNRHEIKSDPVFEEYESRAKFTENNLHGDISYKGSNYGYKLDFDHFYTWYPEYDFFNNQKLYGKFSFSYYFLPETSLKWGLKAGVIDYFFKDIDFDNSDSKHFEAFMGLDGRLTRTINFNFEVGFVYLRYEEGDSFHEPVVRFLITHIVSPLFSINFGYERMPYDSYYSNYYVDQSFSTQFKTIIFSNIINLLKAEYIYREYRDPSRRDNKLRVKTEFALPILAIDKMKKNLSVVLDFGGEWINSDAYNVFNTGPDLAANYEKFFVTLGLTTKY